MLAWALLSNGEIAEGILWIERALSSHAQDAALFATAAALYGAAGDKEREARFQLAGRQINPSSQTFHLHL